ncbi:thiamine phosphate synthase [Parvularcula flava]|nr:thiamine phosphate synthase [Aquisalinus luteolus]NHK28127.1 thiamine phosphate synthase [Aquisalinus luteolus]
MALFTDERAGDPASILEALPRLPGIRLAVIFRHYGAPDREAPGRKLARSCRMKGVVLLVAGDPALALRLRADGMHVPQWQAKTIRGLKKVHPHWIISTSCHDWPSLANAATNAADCAFVSPVFATSSHRGARPLGPLRAHALAAQAELPCLALGGINPQTAGKIKPGIFAGFGAIDGLSRTRT